jgi:hypothetical protein
MMNDGDNKAHGYDLSYSMNNFTITASMNSDYDGDEMTSYGLTYNVTDNLSASFGKTSYGESAVAAVDAVAAVAEVLGSAQVDSTMTTTTSTDWTQDVDTAGNPLSTGSWVTTSTDTWSGFVAAVEAVEGVEGVAASAASSFAMGNTAMSGSWDNGVIGYLGANDEMTSMGVSYDLGDITLSYTMHTISNDDLDANGDDATPSDREATTMSLSYQLNDNCSLSMSRFSDSSLDNTGDGGDDDGERNWLTISIGL